MCHLLIPRGPVSHPEKGTILRRSCLVISFTLFYTVLQCFTLTMSLCPGNILATTHYWKVLVSSAPPYIRLWWQTSEFKSHGSCILSWTVSHNLLHCWNCGVVIPNHMLLQRLVDICLLSEELGTSSAQNSNTSNVFLQSVKARNQDKCVCVKPAKRVLSFLCIISGRHIVCGAAFHQEDVISKVNDWYVWADMPSNKGYWDLRNYNSPLSEQIPYHWFQFRWRIYWGVTATDRLIQPVRHLVCTLLW